MALSSGVTEMIEGQSEGHITFNEAIEWSMAAAGSQILDMDLTAPPGSPSDGDLYLVATGGSGAWDDHDGELALYLSGWKFIDPREGMRFYLDDDKIEVVYREATWCAPERIWSTTEWPMGKIGGGGTMVYQKAVDLGSYPNSTRANVAHGISSLDLTAPIIIEASAYKSSGECYPIMGSVFGALEGGSNRYISVYVDDGTNLWKDANWNASGYSGYCRMEYEKT